MACSQQRHFWQNAAADRLPKISLPCYPFQVEFKLSYPSGEELVISLLKGATQTHFIQQKYCVG